MKIPGKGRGFLFYYVPVGCVFASFLLNMQTFR